MKSIKAKLRNVGSKLLLRGGLRRRWLRRKSAQLTALQQKTLAQSVAKSPRSISHRALPSAGSLRRILFLCDNMWEERELLPELQRLCEVDFIDVHPQVQGSPWGGGESLGWPQLKARLEPLRHQKYDACLVYLRATLLSEEFLETLRNWWQCPLIGLNLDCKSTYDDYRVFRADAVGYKRWAAKYDCNLTNARAWVDVYRADGSNCLYLPTGFHFDPVIHRTPSSEAREHLITFVGSWKPEREAVIAALRRQGVEVQVFGGGWGGQPFIRDAWRVFQKTQINLGIGYNMPDVRITNLKNRDFECPGSGGCYLTTYDWELADLFEIGREILCYRSLDDLMEIYSHYVRRPEDCARIAKAGYERCRRDHTWEQRFRVVFAQLGYGLSAPKKIA